MVEEFEEEPRGEVRAMLVEAASRLLREQGARAVTTRGVAQAAGVQPPTIYRHFRDKDGLLDALAEHVMVEYVHAKPSPGTDDPLTELRAGWDQHIEFGLANPELYLLINTPGRKSPATAAGREVLHHRVHRLAEAGLLRVDEAHAAEIIHAAGSGTIVALLSQPPATRDLSLATAMFDAVTAAILTGRPAAAEPGVLPLAVAFATAVADLPGLSPAERTLMSEWLARAIAELQSRTFTTGSPQPAQGLIHE
ncbi:TetR/AcrR family transcriptional regulator [Actinoplanes siamensis]|uniref:TetR family transcriptional regulator n=1 Tax=Actinoplanes siamensis TaxID=1223317 RepID=A0A919NAM2_9ACTN|nr:TetR/AcrR family transcriptional regulator [Actinoplanes siamensis]GIF07556.1 TetR family transcriptional regulator [Actinoplanes siamensis]